MAGLKLPVALPTRRLAVFCTSPKLDRALQYPRAQAVIVNPLRVAPAIRVPGILGPGIFGHSRPQGDEQVLAGNPVEFLAVGDARHESSVIKTLEMLPVLTVGDAVDRHLLYETV